MSGSSWQSDPTAPGDAAMHSWRLDAALTAALRAVGAAVEASLEEVLGAAWAGVLARAAGRREVALQVGPAEAEPLRLSIEWEEPFRELLRRTRICVSGDVEFRAEQLRLAARQSAEGLELELSGAAELPRPEVARELISALGCALESIAESPDTPLRRLRLMSAERQHEWECWRGERRAIGGPMPYRILEAIPGFREKTAFVCGGGSASYEEYLETARRVVALVRRAGGQPGARVAVMARRSERLPAYLLGVWLAGCATVPVDPAAPASRASFVLEDSGAALLLAERALADLAAGASCAVAWLDEVDDLAPADAWGGLTGESVACVIYTSGSTGRPKGAEILHGAMTNVLEWLERAIPVGPDDVVASVASFAFDACFADFYLAPAVGATVHIADEEEARGGGPLAGLLERSGATYLNVTPTAFTSLLESGWRGAERIKALSGGEALSPQLAAALLGKVGALWNVYGPTETTDISAGARVVDGGPPISLGRPIDNTELYILDVCGHPALPGWPGELAIGGAGLARGYLNRRELTAERFVMLETSDGPRRVYRTGDLARRVPGDRLEFLGRIDHQVKVRGNRVELGEIEAAILDSGGISAAAVVVQDDPVAGPRLAAFYRPDSVIPPRPGQVREALRKRLPDYMVPGLIHCLEQWPRTSSGKVDRQALERFTPQAEAAGSEDKAPGAMEGRVLALFAEVLGRGDLAPDDDFFDAGGHSLLAVRFTNLLRKREGRAMALRWFYANSTARAVAAWLEAETAGGSPE